MKWISVEDELPSIDEHVLLSCYEGICVGYASEVGGYNHYPMGDFASGASVFEVTHWMPLPHPPNASQSPLDLEIPSNPERIEFIKKLKEEEEQYHTDNLKNALGIPTSSQNPHPERNEED